MQCSECGTGTDVVLIVTVTADSREVNLGPVCRSSDCATKMTDRALRWPETYLK